MNQYRCARCCGLKLAREFHPCTIDGILVRTDVCAECAPSLAQLRKDKPIEAWLWPFVQLEREAKKAAARK